MPDAAAPRFLIERVDASPFEAIWPLIADYQRFYGQRPDDSRNRRFFGELLGDTPHGLQLAARQGPHTIGFATLFWVCVSTWAATVALLNDLYARFLREAADLGAPSTWFHYSYPLSIKGEQ
ncbi:GNAT family N-acetyltransferase [Streptomyces sp. RGM 3693]|uniref:GNAT family N-acetyltransferase n=1 Tax=Streptomyces sp. RGM 3693 TaxID=3413284 RepID=UPI003D2BED61